MKGNIVSYTAEEIDAMLARGEDKTDRARVDAKTEEELAADMASDLEWDGVPENRGSRAHRASGLMSGRKENQRQVTMRCDADILDFFKSQRRGWQSRLNAVLRGFVQREHQTPAVRPRRGQRG